MSDEKFLLEYERLLDKGYCDCNEMNCIDNDSPRRILRIAKNLQQENKELKKQLEKKYEKAGTLTGELLYEENTKLINQQKEFIEYLEKEIQRQEDYAVSLGLTIDYDIAEYTSGKIDALKESLSKYKEIIRGRNGN